MDLAQKSHFLDVCALLFVAVLSAPAFCRAEATAPNQPPIQVTGKFTPHNTFELDFNGAIAAYILGAPLGPLDNAAVEELQKLSTRELQAKIDAARRTFAEQLQIRFDGVAAKAEIVFPSPEELRAAQSPEPLTSPPKIHVRGLVPLRALKFTVTFPERLYPLDLTLQKPKAELGTPGQEKNTKTTESADNANSGSGVERLRQTLQKGQTSEPFEMNAELDPSRSDAGRMMVYGVLVGLIVLILGARAFRRPTPLEDLPP